MLRQLFIVFLLVLLVEPGSRLLNVLGPVSKAQLSQSRLHPLLCELLDRRKSKILFTLVTGQAFAPLRAEALHHAGDPGDVVVGGADEGEDVLDGVLPQNPHPGILFGHLGK